MDFKDKARKQNNTLMTDCKNHCDIQDRNFTRINTTVNNVFKKSFTITGNDKYKIPKPESMFTECLWNIEKLQEIKLQLNEVKSKLNCYNFTKWHQHTSQRNKAKDIEWLIRKNFDPEFVTQAWCKFHEIISKYPLVPSENIFSTNNTFTSLHLCEAPGAFITCLNQWLKTNLPTVHWDWLAMTFNPYYEGNSNTKMISDDRFLMHTLDNWFFGSDNTGNLMSLENLDALIQKAKLKGNISLITADGSENCITNPGEQEGIVTNLHFCEVIAAIHILQPGGNFLLKIFTVFEHQSVCLIYFLSCIFKKINFYKPVTSKEGNSEVYMICLNYKGIDLVSPYLPLFRQQYGKKLSTAMFRKKDIPDSFFEQLISCAQIFKIHQCEVLENNIAAYDTNNCNLLLTFEEKTIAKLVADKFITDFPIQKLHSDLQIVGNTRLKRVKRNHGIVEAPAKSFDEIQKQKILEPVQRLLMYEEHFKLLEPTVKTFSFKSDNISIDISINIGKPFHHIKSSRFCSAQILEIYNLLFQTIDLEKNKYLHLPIDKNILLYETKLQQSWNIMYKVLKFHYTEFYDNNQTIACIKKILTDLKIGDDLFIFGFLLLTQFRVGIVYLLTHTFESVDFTINGELGCIIHFKCFKNKNFVLKKFEEIYESQETVVTVDKVILSVIPIMALYSSKLYPIIVKLNNYIAKYCVNYIASVNKIHQSY